MRHSLYNIGKQKEQPFTFQDASPECSAPTFITDDWLRRQNTNAARSCSPISRKISGVAAGTISKIEKQFRERGHVRQLKKNLPNKLSDDQKLDVMLLQGFYRQGLNIPQRKKRATV